MAEFESGNAQKERALLEKIKTIESEQNQLRSSYQTLKRYLALFARPELLCGVQKGFRNLKVSDFQNFSFHSTRFTTKSMEKNHST